ncbi:MAG: benzoyl-CoA reductase subunit C [Fidelibacterota bacterium]
MNFSDYPALSSYIRELFDDLSFGYAQKWKQESASRKVIGFLPIYIPREIIRAAGMLPVGIFGAGDRIPVVQGDAYFQSYICHLPRTVIELALKDNLDHFDGFIFPAICDVIRNLSGIFKLKFPGKFIRYLDFPQNFDPTIGGQFYRSELERLVLDLQSLNQKKLSTKDLNQAITLYNENRRLMNKLNDFRRQYPHLIPAVDFYLIQRAGNLLAVEEYNQLLKNVLILAPQVNREPEDKIKIVIYGSFCEQPPLGLIQTIENAGCYIIDDDFQLGLQWLLEEIPDNTTDPLGSLVTAYLENSVKSAAVYDGKNPKGTAFARRVKSIGADGVIFCAPSFCDPALLDRPQLEQEMDRQHIRHFSFQYHENLGQFHVIREQAGTFADTIKLWE